MGASGIGPVQDELKLGTHLLGPTEVDVGGGVQGDPRVTVAVVVAVEESRAEHPGHLDAPEPAREGGPVLERLELGLREGVSLDWCGRLWLCSTPRSASSWVTVLEVIDDPRSAWMVSWPVGACSAMAVVISSSASAADSRGATSHPGT